MGAEQSTESWQQPPPEDSRSAANPPGASFQHTLPAYGADFATDGATDSDSEVEYDKQSTSAATVSSCESREPAAASEAAPQQLLQPLVESSEPAWAEGLSSSQPCSSRLELQFVYGYRGVDCRHNLCLLPSGEVAFPAANLVVVFEARAGRQRFSRP